MLGHLFPMKESFSKKGQLISILTLACSPIRGQIEQGETIRECMSADVSFWLARAKRSTFLYNDKYNDDDKNKRLFLLVTV